MNVIESSFKNHRGKMAKKMFLHASFKSLEFSLMRLIVVQQPTEFVYGVPLVVLVKVDVSVTFSQTSHRLL